MTPVPASQPLTAPGIRLAKCVAALKASSRREAEQYIEGGWVSVAGQVVEEPQFRVVDQAVVINPQASLLAPAAVTLLLHKLPGYDAGTGEPVDIKGLGKGIRQALTLVAAESRSSDDRSGIALLRKHLTGQVLCLPLESRASGLVVFTQDWRIDRKLTEDAGDIEQEFTVEISGEVAPDAIERLNRGLTAEGRALPPVKVSVSSTSDTVTRLRIAFKGPHPGLIAYLCDRVALRILSMKRIRIGRMPMTSLAPGQWRFLMPYERF